jgi:hypothetical protein
LPRRKDMKKIDRSDVICIVAAAILLFMTVLAVLGTDRSGYQIWSGIFTSLICLVPMLFRQAGVMKLPFALVVLIEVAIFLHGYGVLLMKYDDLVWYDTITHTVSTITVALCVFYALMTVELLDHQTTFSPKWIPLFITLIMLTFSIYWEVFELIVDIIWNTNMQYSPWDTIRDMVFNSVGALVITVSSRFYLKDHTCEEFIKNLELHPALKDKVLPQWSTDE